MLEPERTTKFDDRRTRLERWIGSGAAKLQPLTFPQRELWEASSIPVADVANHICALIHVRGSIKPQDCVASMQRIVNRQEVLRLSFLPGKEQAMPLIRTHSEPAIRFRKLSHSQETPEAIEDLAQETFLEPFDLMQGPLYRVDVLSCSADSHVLVFAIHHAIADGWTLGVFVQDLCVAYAQEHTGVGDELPPVPTSYTEWGAAERAFWQPSKLERGASFWKSRLVGVRRLWSGGEESQTASRARLRLVSFMPHEIGRAARDLARRGGATLFSTLLSAFQVTLSKWTGADDILVGTPVANRVKQSVHETMGYFAGIVPLRGQIDRERTFSDGLRSVHLATVDSFANATPFAELVRALGDSPAPGHNPIFEVRFALQNHPIPDVEFRDLSLKLRMRSTGTARFDLGCEITENGEALEVVWLFRADMFSQLEIKDLDHLFLAVLVGACRSPESRIGTLLS